MKKEERQKLDEDGHRARDQTEYKVSGSFARTKGDEVKLYTINGYR